MAGQRAQARTGRIQEDGVEVADPVGPQDLQIAGIRRLRLAQSVAKLLWIGIGMLLVAWLRLGRWTIDRGRVSEYTMIATTGFWLAPLLLSVPLFSRDTYSYLAQGALLRDGFDPYVVGPIDNPNSLLDNVSSIWTTTAAPYGPATTQSMAASIPVTGSAMARMCPAPFPLMPVPAPG
jgi:hypothetical protein